MKRLIMIMLVCLLTLNVRAVPLDSATVAQAKSIVMMPDSQKLTWLKVYEDTKEGIASLAKALKVPAEHVYAVLVRQQVVNAIAWLIGCLIPLIIPLWIAKRGWRLAKETSDSSNEEDKPLPYIFWFIGCIIIPGISLLILIFHVKVIATGFVNPEYGAIQDIWNFVKH